MSMKLFLQLHVRVFQSLEHTVIFLPCAYALFSSLGSADQRRGILLLTPSAPMLCSKLVSASQVKVIGFLTDEILITRGVRQGDPPSALLYIIVAEVLRNLIRTNKDIKGITIKEIEQKILQYADDTQI